MPDAARHSQDAWARLNGRPAGRYAQSIALLILSDERLASAYERLTQSQRVLDKLGEARAARRLEAP